MLNKSIKMLKNKYVSINCYFFIFIIELAQYARKVPHKEPDIIHMMFITPIVVPVKSGDNPPIATLPNMSFDMS